MEANALHPLIVDCVDLIGRSGKAVAGIVVAVDPTYFFRRIA